MAQIAHGGLAGLFGSSNDLFVGSYFINEDGFLSDSSGNVIGNGVFDEEIAALHRSFDAIILPDGWTSWIPDPVNNEWDDYSIGTAPIVGTASMIDGSGVDLPSADVLQDDYDHDTIRYVFDPTAAAWQSLSYGETLTVTFTVYAEEYGLFGNVTDTDTFEVTLNFTKICFARGTLIEAEAGPLLIENLRPGMLIRTKDNGLQPIRWIGSSVVGGNARQIPQNLKPIRISAGALGGNTPSRDLVVSPQHRILVKSAIAQKMFGTAEVLVAAKQLLQVDGVDIDSTAERVEYFHMMFDRHEIVVSNGALTESLYLGAEALKGLGKKSVDEILEILPQLRETLEADAAAAGARLLVSGRMGRKLASRHVQNRKSLVM